MELIPSDTGKEEEEEEASLGTTSINPGITRGSSSKRGNGRTCHQCRNKKGNFVACTQIKKNKPCALRFCQECLSNRYEVNISEIARSNWRCPKCCGECNCSICRTKNGKQPLGRMSHNEHTGFPNTRKRGKRRKLKMQDVLSSLPTRPILTKISGIEVAPKDVGPALQFLEFYRAFSKVLCTMEGETECILQEIQHGHLDHHGPSALVQFQKSLLFYLQLERGADLVSQSARSGDAWLKDLMRIVNESKPSDLKEFPSESLEGGISGYNKLDSAWKLRILNFLCSETLSTRFLRNFIVDENNKASQKEKMDKKSLLAAKTKKLELRKTIMNAKVTADDATRNTDEYKMMTSAIKKELAELSKTIKLLSDRKARRDVMRTQPMLMEGNGEAYWMLDGCVDSCTILLQVCPKAEDQGDITNDEKWYYFSPEEEKVILKHISMGRKLKRRITRNLNAQHNEQNS